VGIFNTYGCERASASRRGLVLHNEYTEIIVIANEIYIVAGGILVGAPGSTSKLSRSTTRLLTAMIAGETAEVSYVDKT
jgi:hypothetical protein